jgi:plastocyanin domain-containing protein
MDVLGFSINDMFTEKREQSQNQDIGGLAPIVDGKQLIAMTVYPARYNPDYFKVKAGVPVKWEITSSGRPGCASGAVIARGLIDGLLYLNPNSGQVTVAEFTPQNSGIYKFSCTMNMVRGTIEVVN